MKYKKIKEIKNVKLKPVFTFDKMWTFDLEDKMHIFEIETLKQIELKYFGGKINIEVIDNEVYIYLDDSLGKISLETLDLEKVWKKMFGQIAYLDKQYIAEQLYDRRSKKLHLAMYERTTCRLMWEKDFYNHRFARSFAEGLFLTDISFTYFICLNLDTGQESWTYSFPEDEKVQGDIYMHEGVLVVPSMAGQMPYNKNYLQGVDVNTGKEIWKNEGYFLHLQQDSQTGLLYGFAGEKYQVIDPITGNKIVDKEFTGLKEEKRLFVTTPMNRLYGNGLYFISDYVENHYDCQFGKINTESHEIEFIQKLDVAEGVKADPPIYHKGKLYIKDTLGTLHVYERE